MEPRKSCGSQNNHSCTNMCREECGTGVFTESGGQLIGSELPACPPVQEGIHELAVILAEAGLVADVVEFTCTAKQTGRAQRSAEGGGGARSQAHR